MRHADLRREATNSSDSKGSVGTVVLYCCVVPGISVWACGCVLFGGSCDAMGSKIRGETFSTEFFDWRILSKKSSFRLDPPVGISVEKS